MRTRAGRLRADGVHEKAKTPHGDKRGFEPGSRLISPLKAFRSVGRGDLKHKVGGPWRAPFEGRSVYRWDSHPQRPRHGGSFPAMSANFLMVSAVVIVFAYLLAITAWPRKYSLHAFMTFPPPAVRERGPSISAIGCSTERTPTGRSLL